MGGGLKAHLGYSHSWMWGATAGEEGVFYGLGL